MAVNYHIKAGGLIAALLFVFFSTCPAGIFFSKDKQAPVIKLKNDNDSLIVFMDKFLLEAEVADNKKLASVIINDTLLDRPKGSHAFISEIVKLKPGENFVAVIARDNAGNETKKTLVIVCKKQSSIQVSERLRLVVLPFERKGANRKKGAEFEDKLVNALMAENRFRMIERGVIDEILREQIISQTRLFNKKTVSRLGKLATAQAAITGAIIHGQPRLEIVARLVDTETSEVLSTQTISGKSNDPAGLSHMATAMALKFHNDFPLTDGHVIERTGTKIRTTLDQTMVKPGRTLVVCRQVPIKHPKTGKVIGMDNQIISRARITMVYAESSIAELIDNVDVDIKPMDRVITE
ncbi:MAG: hypothetical protein GY699_01510 [Desulfobacteraceae bacterium]|nr:hypothetical protein [Desulfobacteraceae bacterium]